MIYITFSRLLLFLAASCFFGEFLGIKLLLDELQLLGLK